MKCIYTSNHSFKVYFLKISFKVLWINNILHLVQRNFHKENIIFYKTIFKETIASSFLKWAVTARCFLYPRRDNNDNKKTLDLFLKRIYWFLSKTFPHYLEFKFVYFSWGNFALFIEELLFKYRYTKIALS